MVPVVETLVISYRVLSFDEDDFTGDQEIMFYYYESLETNNA